MSPGAVVLCGGESRRMGRSKAWLPFGPERLLQRVVRLAGTVARPVVVVAAPGQDIPELPGDVAVVRDPVAGRGPLQGLATGFAAVPDSVELIYATATDVPFLEPRWITRLVELMVGVDLVIPRIGGLLHPLAALYRQRAMLAVFESALAQDRSRLTSLADLALTLIVEEEDMRDVDPEFGTVRNLNHIEDYKQALRDASGPLA